MWKWLVPIMLITCNKKFFPFLKIKWQNGCGKYIYWFFWNLKKKKKKKKKNIYWLLSDGSLLKFQHY